MSQSERDHHANQNNPNNPAYQDAQDNHANQLNPEHDEYWHSREEEQDGKES